MPRQGRTIAPLDTQHEIWGGRRLLEEGPPVFRSTWCSHHEGRPPRCFHGKAIGRCSKGCRRRRLIDDGAGVLGDARDARRCALRLDRRKPTLEILHVDATLASDRALPAWEARQFRRLAATRGADVTESRLKGIAKNGSQSGKLRSARRFATLCQRGNESNCRCLLFGPKHNVALRSSRAQTMVIIVTGKLQPGRDARCLVDGLRVACATKELALRYVHFRRHMGLKANRAEFEGSCRPRRRRPPG